MPVPTSSTTSSGVTAAASNSTSSRFKSIRKFWPNFVCGRMPASSKRRRRKESVWREVESWAWENDECEECMIA